MAFQGQKLKEVNFKQAHLDFMSFFSFFLESIVTFWLLRMLSR